MIVKSGLPEGPPSKKAVQFGTQPPMEKSTAPASKPLHIGPAHGQVEKAEFLSKPPVSEAQRAAMGAAAGGHSTLGIPKKVGQEFIEADRGGKLPETKKYEGYAEESPKAKRTLFAESANKVLHPSDKKKDEKMAPKNPIVKNSIFKRETKMSKEEFPASRRYSIKLGKQEFFIDLKNANDPAKRLKNVAPADGTKDPFTSDPKSQETSKWADRGSDGADIKKNPPKAGPDQKNDSAPIITDAAKKSAPGQQHGVTATGPNKNSVKQSKENTSIQKGEYAEHAGTDIDPHDSEKPGYAEGYVEDEGRPCPECGGEGNHMGNLGARKHYNCRNCGMWFSPREEEVEKAEMGAPKAPKAPGMGAPKLSGARMPKPPAAGKPAGPGKMAMSEASFNILKSLRKSIHGVPESSGSGSPETSKITKTTVMGLEESTGTGEPRKGTVGKGEIGGVPTSEGSGSPETSKITKGEMCKACGKMHKAGMCKAMDKALMPFSATKEAVQRDMGSAPTERRTAPKATPKDPGQFDASAFKPTAPVKSGLFTHQEMHQPPVGTGVTPKPSAPLPGKVPGVGPAK